MTFTVYFFAAFIFRIDFLAEIPPTKKNFFCVFGFSNDTLFAVECNGHQQSKLFCEIHLFVAVINEVLFLASIKHLARSARSKF